MKKFKAILALVLVAALFVTLFAACAKTEEKPNTDGGKDNTSNTDTNKEPAKDNDDDKAPADDTDEPADAGEEALVPFEDERELVIALYDVKGTNNDFGDHVEEYANSITKETLNVVADYLWISPGDWKAKTDVAIASGERFDIINLSPMTRVTTLYPQGLLTALDEYIEDYASGVYELTKEYIGTYTLGGNIYGFPTVRNYCKNGYILMRHDVLEDLGLVEAAQNMTCWSDWENIMEKVNQKYAGTYHAFAVSSPMCADNFISGDSFADAYAYDNMGDSTGTLYVDQETTKVSVIQASEMYKYNVSQMQKWFDLGYVWPDSAITDLLNDDVMKQGLTWASMSGSEHGVEVTKESMFGFDIDVKMFVTGMVKTNQPVFTGIAVPVTAEEPEAAVAWINELYTNYDLMMAMIYGVPDVDYSVENGEVVPVTEKHYQNVDFVLGNSTILTPLQGNGADFYDVVKQINETAPKSNFLGFIIDNTGMELWISQITAVTDQYSAGMVYGAYSEAALADYLAKLEAAGVNDYAAAAQEQIDAWVAANK